MPLRMEALLLACLTLMHLPTSSISSMSENALPNTFLSPLLPFLACLSVSNHSDHSSPLNLLPFTPAEFLSLNSCPPSSPVSPTVLPVEGFLTVSFTSGKEEQSRSLGLLISRSPVFSHPVSYVRLSETVLQHPAAVFMFVLSLDSLPPSSHDVCHSNKTFTLTTRCFLQLQQKTSRHPLAILSDQ